ncbi:MAG: hypothetical protein AAF320_00870 [Myxococcota bacterium]
MMIQSYRKGLVLCVLMGTLCLWTGCFDLIGNLDFQCDPLKGGLHVNPRAYKGERSTGRSWADPLGTVQQALEKAQSDPSIRHIYITKGVYTLKSEGKSQDPSQPVLMLSGLKDVKLWGGFDGNEKCIQDRRPSQHAGTIFNGVLWEDDETQTQEYVWHVAKVQHVSNLHLENIVIRGGRATQCNAPADDSCNHGGGIYVGEDVEGLRMTGLTLENNHARFGGAFYASHCPLCFFDGCLFRYNKALESQETGGVGGALFVRDSRSLNRKSPERTFTISGGHFQHNEASMGGAVAATKSDLFVLGTEFRHNKALSEGGGIWLADQSVLQLEKAWFVSNHADIHGGAISVSWQSTLQELEDNHFQENKQGTGEEIFRETLPGETPEDTQ